MTPDFIKSLRAKYGLSMEGLADKVQTSRFTVWKWENGTVPQGPARVLLWLIDKSPEVRKLLGIKEPK